ncbi:hypothetical protein MKX33_00600 [Paenibacillus sp. FSL R5-0490]
MCKSTSIKRARNDSGFFKADGIKPIRTYNYRCDTCGFVAAYAKEEAK